MYMYTVDYCFGDGEGKTLLHTKPFITERLPCFLCACLRSDPGRHSVGSVISDRWGQRADPDGHRLWSRPSPRAAAQPQGGQSSGELPLPPPVTHLPLSSWSNRMAQPS